MKLSFVVLSMQDLVFDHSDPDRKSGEGMLQLENQGPNANSSEAMAYLVAILKELRKDVLSRADSMYFNDDPAILTNMFISISPHSVPSSKCEERPKQIQAELPGATIPCGDDSLHLEIC